MIALGYIRRSKKSEAKTVSLEEQAQRIADYCASKGWTLAEVLRHDGISGTKRKRFVDIDGALLRFGADALVVYNLDRLARDAGGLLDALKSYQSRGIQIHESSSGLIGDKALDRLMVGVRGVMDEYYALVIGEKTSDALQGLRWQGKRYTWLEPFGYRYAGGLMVADPTEQGIISQARTLRQEGLSYRAVVRKLRAEGYKGRLNHETVRRLCLPE